jgi:hypothetical protein
VLSDFDVAGNGLNGAGCGVDPQGVLASFALKLAAMRLQVPQKIAAFH